MTKMTNKLITILVSVAIAFGLWLYVITVVSPESENSYYDVPVVFDGLAYLDSRDLMITSGTDATVDLKLLGNRTDLNKLDKTNITILADLSKITTPGVHTVKYTISYPSSAGTIEVLDQDPQYITVHVSKRVRKEVPVRIQEVGAVPENFVADVQNAVLNHKIVTVTGPEEVVSQIYYADISVDLTGRTDTIVETHRHTLCDRDGNPVEDVSSVTVNVSEIQLTVKVVQIKEIPIEVIIKDGGGLTAQEVTAVPNWNSILVSGPVSSLLGLNKIQVEVDLNKLTESQILRFPIQLPEGVTNETGISEVEVDVRIPEMTTKMLVIPRAKFIFLNVPEGLNPVADAVVLRVYVRGRENRLAEVTEENITVTIDLAGATVGRDRYTCMIEITGVSDVGVVYSDGDYIIMVSLNPTPEAGM